MAANVNYTATLGAEDSDGVATSKTLYFDTFAENSYVIEIEDYNFSIDGVSGKFIDNPVLISEGSGPQADAYSLKPLSKTWISTTPARRLVRRTPCIVLLTRFECSILSTAFGRNTRPRAVRMLSFSTMTSVTSKRVSGWITRGLFRPGLTKSISVRPWSTSSGESVLEEVTGDITQPSQTTKVLGSFLGGRTGFQHRNFALTDATGQNKVILRLSGATTLRLRQVTADARRRALSELPPLQSCG